SLLRTARRGKRFVAQRRLVARALGIEIIRLIHWAIRYFFSWRRDLRGSRSMSPTAAAAAPSAPSPASPAAFTGLLWLLPRQLLPSTGAAAPRRKAMALTSAAAPVVAPAVRLRPSAMRAVACAAAVCVTLMRAHAEFFQENEPLARVVEIELHLIQPQRLV